MADYWKSMPRKFCDFCKCWITDNKPSIEYHERGKKHQENVKRKIDEVKKKSIEKAQQQQELEDDFRQMEKAALEAFKKDLIENPSLAAQYRVKVKSKGDESCEKFPSEDVTGDSEEAAPLNPVAVREWFEAVSNQGYTYYWNVSTNESIWEAPESYVSLAEQGIDSGTSQQDPSLATEAAAAVEDPETPAAQQSPVLEETKEDSDKKDDKHAEDSSNESESKSENEKSESEEDEDKPSAKRSDRKDSRSAYGMWETITTQEPVDLELPVESYPVETFPLPDASKPEKRHQFKEKTVKSLGDPGEHVEFKKRKLGTGARNVRQRRGDDD